MIAQFMVKPTDVAEVRSVLRVILAEGSVDK